MLTALDRWMLLCMIFIVMTLVEFALMLVIKYHFTFCPKRSVECGMSNENAKPKLITKIDRISFVMYFVVFLLSSVLYFSLS